MGHFKSSNISPEERQIARKQQLKDYCLHHTFKQPLGAADVHALAVDDKQKFIYCVIPKVSTSTWKKVLARPRGITPLIKRWDMWRHFSNYTEEERSQRLQNYFKFVFVREPLQRLLSAYKDKFIRHAEYSKDIRKVIVQALRPQEFEPRGENFVSFSEFIQYFSENVTRDKHWGQYEQLCHPCAINYDFIGHLETLEEDAALMLKMAGIDNRATFPPIHNVTGSSEVLEYYSQVPPQYITRLGELYRTDFDMFGYDYLGPIKQLLNQK
ncbi:Carbohydrate (chondroitin 4) sulfotransferase 13 [Desmophyllum pertusum]|uniref:Carbohydrate sulfotransferase n=1 Tax=Desmophyllum pertusum TaxID=174260 RepID=A0A9W9ZPK7_9CNID|nr:Carbohydrate (chondroitin 4) sulfotransferase 13 [Desmophyllum pertusum]